MALNLALLCNISHRLRGLNTKFQGHHIPVSDMFGVVRAPEIKLKSCRRQKVNVNTWLLPFSNLFHKDGSLSVRAIEMIFFGLEF